MLVIEQSKALALKLSRPQVVLESIRTAKILNTSGGELVVLPHKLDEVRVLNNLGIAAPSPILHYYDWPGRFAPYEHQRMTSAFLTLTQRGLVLNEIGTGKSLSALWAADYLMQLGEVGSVLILSPLSTLERVWGDAIYMDFIHRKFVVLYGSAERRLRLAKQKVDFYICNHDGFQIVAPTLTDRIQLLIVDEAAVYRNPGSKRFKYLMAWIKANPNVRLWFMTGTPTPNAPTDALALGKLVGNPGANVSTKTFRDSVMLKVSMWRYVPRENALETVRQILQPSVRYTRDECFDLPATVVQTRKVELTPVQVKHYKQMLKHLLVEVAADAAKGGTITAVNEAVKVQKLVQIACGVAYGDNGENIALPCGPRVHATCEVIEEAGSKVIVFVPLTGTLHMLEEELSRYWTVAVVNGEVSSAKRDAIFHSFQHDKDPHVLIAHPGTMAHGLTLTAASTIIWYGPTTSNDQYEQACGRVERIGKVHTSNVVHIEATTLEHQMYRRLQDKQQMQGLLLDMIQEQTRR